MVTEVEMTVWIRSVQGCEKVKDQDVDETHGKNEEVYSQNEIQKVLLKVDYNHVIGIKTLSHCVVGGPNSEPPRVKI